MPSINSLYSSLSQQISERAYKTQTLDGFLPVNAKKTGAANLNKNTMVGAYMLDLSPQARSFLGGFGSQQANRSTYTTPIIPSRVQWNAIDQIVKKYKDEPVTMETFDKIQNELATAGLSAEKLAMNERARNFNANASLLSSLFGRSRNSNVLSEVFPSGGVDPQVQANYQRQVMAKWLSVSTQAKTGSVTA